VANNPMKDRAVVSDSSISSGTSISTIPEELRQSIISHLNYADAWSLKRTSPLFLKVVEILTIRSFLSNPYGPSLCRHEDWQVIPLGYEACWYCRQLLPADKLSWYQRRLTAARKDSLTCDYGSWKAEKHFCIECGVKLGQYQRGERIYTGFGDPGYTDVAVVPCFSCGTAQDDDLSDCNSCGAFKICMDVTEVARDNNMSVAEILDLHRPLTESCSSRKVFHCGNFEISRPGSGREPDPKTCTYVRFRG